MFQLSLWDTAGHDRAGAMTSTYYRNSHGILLMYDVTDPGSLVHCAQWKEEAERYSYPVYFLAGNKCDLENECEVEEEVARNFAQKHNIPADNVFRISVKTGDGIDEMFANILSKLVKECNKVLHENFLDLNLKSTKQSRKCC